MKGIKFYLFSAIMALAVIFFSANIFLKFYFNQFLYETPNLTGKGVREAEILIDEGRFKVTEMGEDFSALPKGKIYAQLPKAGSVIKRGRIIKVWTSKGEDRINLPDLSKFTLDEARAEVEKLGLTIKNISYTSKSNVPFHQVITTTPQRGSLVYRNQQVSLLVNTKTTGAMVRVPDIIGMDLGSVERRLKSQKLLLGNVSYIENYDLQGGVVVDMSVQPGESVPEGTVIDVTINR